MIVGFIRQENSRRRCNCACQVLTFFQSASGYVLHSFYNTICRRLILSHLVDSIFVDSWGQGIKAHVLLYPGHYF